MTYAQVYTYFKSKRDAECPITDKLIREGFQQQRGTGYLLIAEKSEIENPSQWWHIMNYCLKKYEMHLENERYRHTPCGELVFWMAEVSGAVSKGELEELQKEIINRKLTRSEGNKRIKELCFEKVKETVEKRK